MSQTLLQDVSRDLVERAEEASVPAAQFGRLVDAYFVERLKKEELEHAPENTRLYDGLRGVIRTEVLPLYEAYLAEVGRLRERKARRRPWTFVLGTVVGMELLGVLLTRGRSLAPQLLFVSALANGLLGLLIYAATQYVDDRRIASARRRLEQALVKLGSRLATDLEYDQRRDLLEGEMLPGEVLEVVGRYSDAAGFWRDYARVRQTDPTTTADVEALGLAAFAGFLRPHVEGRLSSVARQDRFNRLFLAAHEHFIRLDRAGYVPGHLASRSENRPTPRT